MPCVGILANSNKPGAPATVRALRQALEARGSEVLLDKQSAALAGATTGIPAKELAGRIDLAAIIGGDGTMLDALSRLGVFEKPMAGINIGRLGFLTTCTEGEVDQFAAAVSTGSYAISARALLEAVVHRAGEPAQGFTALNEVVLARGTTGRLVSVTARVDGELLNHYRADGLIVASPTGSTAYSLAAGGPLIAPGSGVFVVTPICPHSLSQRSLVLADSSKIEIAPDGGDCAPMLFTVDGRDTLQIGAGDRVVVKRSPRVFRLLLMEGHSFYGALRQKLHWLG